MASDNTIFRLTYNKICHFDGNIREAYGKGAENLKTLMERLTSQRVRAGLSIIKSTQSKV